MTPLPGTRREAEAVAAMLPGSTLLLGQDATAPRLRAAVFGSKPRIVHLATHGLTGNAQRPYEASLALTQPKECTPQDIGFLRLEDLISKWGGRLNGCKLVVLSACDTQRGVQQGDSVMSLPLGYFFAGARTVMASLWKVDDTATMLLMTRFYENLLGRFDAPRSIDGTTYAAGKPLSKLAALREAKQWLRKLPATEVRRVLKLTDETEWAAFRRRYRALGEATVTAAPDAAPVPDDQTPLYAHPHYWAAFILIGDPG